MEERQMIKKIQHGERCHLNELIQFYYDDIYRFCCYMTGNETDAYDITQNTFLNLIRFIDTYQSHNFKAYLFTIARNNCNNYFRNRAFHDNIDDCSIMNSVDEYQKIDNSYLIRHALNLLPAQQKDVIILYYYHGFKLREIASITNTKLPTIKSRLSFGKKNLKSILQKEGVSDYEG